MNIEELTQKLNSSPLAANVTVYEFSRDDVETLARICVRNGVLREGWLAMALERCLSSNVWLDMTPDARACFMMEWVEKFMGWRSMGPLKEWIEPILNHNHPPQ